MLNRLFNVSAGFEWGVRACAFFVLTLSLLSNILINPNAPSSEARPPKAKLKVILTDAPYLLANASYVCTVSTENMGRCSSLVYRTLVINWGLFFPCAHTRIGCRESTLTQMTMQTSISNCMPLYTASMLTWPSKRYVDIHAHRMHCLTRRAARNHERRFDVRTDSPEYARR